MEKIDNKDIIKVIISSGTEKPYYLRKKGRTPEGCYLRVGSSKERMIFEMIDTMYSKEEQGLQLNENFLKNVDLLTSEGKYNYNAFLLEEENNVSIKVVKYLGTDKMDLVKNQEYGYRCIITATQRY